MAVVALALLIVAIVVAVRLVPMISDRTPATGQPRFESLAVLPFENLMNDPEQDYFVDGMQEALITDLAKIGSLRVISRTSAVGPSDSTSITSCHWSTLMWS